MKYAFLLILIFKFPEGLESATIQDPFNLFNQSKYDRNINIDRTLTGYKKVTKSNTGCACWFDPLEKFTTAGDCACCKGGKKGGVQCGYPMHNYCQPKVKKGEELTGCEGISHSYYISSTHIEVTSYS